LVFSVLFSAADDGHRDVTSGQQFGQLRGIHVPVAVIGMKIAEKCLGKQKAALK
jgi:hypothetical protein